MSSKKGSMVMMLAVMAMVLMADFLTCHDQNMNVNGNYTEHRSRHLGHDHDEYYDPHGHGHYSNSNNNKKMEVNNRNIISCPISSY